MQFDFLFADILLANRLSLRFACFVAGQLMSHLRARLRAVTSTITILNTPARDPIPTTKPHLLDLTARQRFREASHVPSPPIQPESVSAVCGASTSALSCVSSAAAAGSVGLSYNSVMDVVLCCVSCASARSQSLGCVCCWVHWPLFCLGVVSRFSQRPCHAVWCLCFVVWWQISELCHINKSIRGRWRRK